MSDKNSIKTRTCRKCQKQFDVTAEELQEHVATQCSGISDGIMDPRD